MVGHLALTQTVDVRPVLPELGKRLRLAHPPTGFSSLPALVEQFRQARSTK